MPLFISFNYFFFFLIIQGARDRLYCAAHGGGKRCRSDGCNKSAVGGSDLCTAHGGGKRCQYEGMGL